MWRFRIALLIVAALVATGAAQAWYDGRLVFRTDLADVAAAAAQAPVGERELVFADPTGRRIYRYTIRAEDGTVTGTCYDRITVGTNLSGGEVETYRGFACTR